MMGSMGCGYNSSGSGTMAGTAPTVTLLMPSSMAAGGAAFTLTVSGTKVTASITAADIATAQSVGVYVRNPGGTGIYMNQPGQSSNTVQFTVSP
jgi:hypothetical protein